MMRKVTFEIKRKMIQVVAFGYSNLYLGNFLDGRLYKGKWKSFCNPGMNCYSCPAATTACPIGAMQAVNGSIDFKTSFYVWGMILAFGVILGRAVCGFLCPFGLIQELLYKSQFPKKKLWKGFTWIKYILLVVFVLMLPVVKTNAVGSGAPAFCEYICPVGTLEGGIPAPFHTSGTAPCDRDIIFRENGNPGDHTGGMFEYLQVFLQSDVSAGSNLWTFE